jgi:hypothetical protein
MKPITREPTRLSSAGALLVALLAALTVSPYSALALGLAGLGTLALGAGLAVGSRPLATLGPLGVFAGAVAAGTDAAPVPITLFGILGAVLAYDLAGTAIDIGAQLGRETDTRRLELVHIATSSLVGATIAIVSYLVYTFGAGGQPISAVVGLLLAVVVLFVALRRQQPTG